MRSSPGAGDRGAGRAVAASPGRRSRGGRRAGPRGTGRPGGRAERRPPGDPAAGVHRAQARAGRHPAASAVGCLHHRRHHRRHRRRAGGVHRRARRTALGQGRDGAARLRSALPSVRRRDRTRRGRPARRGRSDLGRSRVRDHLRLLPHTQPALRGLRAARAAAGRRVRGLHLLRPGRGPHPRHAPPARGRIRRRGRHRPLDGRRAGGPVRGPDRLPRTGRALAPAGQRRPRGGRTAARTQLRPRALPGAPLRPGVRLSVRRLSVLTSPAGSRDS